MATVPTFKLQTPSLVRSKAFQLNTRRQSVVSPQSGSANLTIAIGEGSVANEVGVLALGAFSGSIPTEQRPGAVYMQEPLGPADDIIPPNVLAMLYDPDSGEVILGSDPHRGDGEHSTAIGERAVASEPGVLALGFEAGLKDASGNTITQSPNEFYLPVGLSGTPSDPGNVERPLMYNPQTGKVTIM